MQGDANTLAEGFGNAEKAKKAIADYAPIQARCGTNIVEAAKLAHNAGSI